MGTMEDSATALMRIEAALLRIAAAMEFSAAAGTTASRANGALNPQPQYIPPSQPQYQPPQTPNMLQPQAPQGITAEAITALIQPHVGNVQIKEALGATMREMGINALPDTQAHQFGELYQRFQGVIARFTQNPQPGPTPGASII